MTAADQLKQAVQTLRQAAQTRSTEVSDLRNTVVANEKARQDFINDAKQRQTMRAAEAAETDSDMIRASRANDIRTLEQEQSQANQDYDRQKKDLDNQISLKQRNVDEINQMAQIIERDWIPL